MMDFDGAELKSSHAGVAGNENCIVQTHVIGLLALFCTLALSVLLGYGLLHNLDTPVCWFKNNEDQT